MLLWFLSLWHERSEIVSCQMWGDNSERLWVVFCTKALTCGVQEFLRVVQLFSRGWQIDTTAGAIDIGLRFSMIFTLNQKKPSFSPRLVMLPIRLHRLSFIFREAPRGPTLQFAALICEQCVPWALTSSDQKLCSGGGKKKKKSFLLRAETSLRSMETTKRFCHRCVRETRGRLMEREYSLIHPLKDASDGREVDRTGSSSFINHTGGPPGRGSTMHLFKSGAIKTWTSSFSTWNWLIVVMAKTLKHLPYCTTTHTHIHIYIMDRGGKKKRYCDISCFLSH